MYTNDVSRKKFWSLDSTLFTLFIFPEVTKCSKFLSHPLVFEVSCTCFLWFSGNNLSPSLLVSFFLFFFLQYLVRPNPFSLELKDILTKSSICRDNSFTVLPLILFIGRMPNKMTVNQFNLIGKRLQYKMKKKKSKVNQMLLNIARVFWYVHRYLHCYFPR